MQQRKPFRREHEGFNQRDLRDQLDDLLRSDRLSKDLLRGEVDENRIGGPGVDVNRRGQPQPGPCQMTASQDGRSTRPDDQWLIAGDLGQVCVVRTRPGSAKALFKPRHKSRQFITLRDPWLRQPSLLGGKPCRIIAVHVAPNARLSWTMMADAPDTPCERCRVYECAIVFAVSSEPMHPRL